MLRVRLFGGLALEVGGSTVPLPTSRRARVLLGWLALHPGRHARAELAARLRPDVLDVSAQASLRQAMWALRQSLGAAAPALEATRAEVGLVPGPDVEVDVWEVDRLLRAGEAEEALARADAGELLRGLDEDWVYDAREAYRMRFARAVAAAADLAEQRGDIARATELTRRWVGLDPLDEQAHRSLLGRLAASGDNAGAIVAYDRLVRVLREDLGLAPSAETQALMRRVRRDAAPIAGPPAPQDPVGTTRPVPLRLPSGRWRGSGAPASRLVGREQDIGWLAERWRRARSEGPALALVTGEAGIGKTRLISEFSRQAHASGAHVLYGSCSPDPLVSYEPFVVALRHYVTSCPPDVRATLVDSASANALSPILPELSSASVVAAGVVADRLRLFDAVTRLVAAIARDRPLLLVLDDLHWADPGTVHLLRHVVQLLDRVPVLVVGLYRPTDINAAVVDALADLGRVAWLPTHELGGLAEPSVDQLLSGWTGGDPPPGLVGAIWKRTGGNPFFVEEIVAHLVASGILERRAGQWVWDLAREDVTIPTGVAQAIRRRVDRLGTSTRRFLAAASVYGLVFPVTLVRDVLGLDDATTSDAVEEAIAAGLLAEAAGVPNSCTFVHPLTRETVYGDLSTTRRGLLHRDIAHALSRAPGSLLVSVGERAHHLARGVPYGAPATDAILAARAAGEEAMRQHAHEDAVRWFDEALALVPEEDRAQRREIFSRRGVALTARWHELRDAPRPRGIARSAT